MKKTLSLLFFGLTLLNCKGNSDSGGGSADSNNENKPSKQSYVKWDSIPSEFNPSTEDIPFQTDGVEKIKVNILGFDRDVDVIYSQDIKANQGLLRVFTVWKESASWGKIASQRDGKDLNLRPTGSYQYQCSIQVHNGNIESLKGGCYIRLQVFLPVGSEIEVYNLDQLMTQRFVPVDNETLLKQLDKSPWAEDKFTAIENYLASYTGSKKPSMTCKVLSQALHGFIRSEDKLNALRKLQATTSDRENLDSMIEDEFSYFDRPEARKIVGLN